MKTMNKPFALLKQSQPLRKGEENESLITETGRGSKPDEVWLIFFEDKTGDDRHHNG